MKGNKLFLSISIVLIFALLFSLFFLISFLGVSEPKELENSVTNTETKTTSTPKKEKENINNSEYTVFQYNDVIGYFDVYEEALEFAKAYAYTAISKDGSSSLVWNNYPQFIVYISKDEQYEFYSYDEALEYAKTQTDSNIYFRENSAHLWDHTYKIPNSFLIENVPEILQLPELPRGCEITSLAMLINHMGVKVNKLELADEITYNPAVRKMINGKIHYGNPNDGFVGSITDINKDGLGVYHKPVFELLQNYFPKTSIDITGTKFDTIKTFISKGSPVWVIINTRYEKLLSYDEEWHTPTGIVDITYKEHSVLLTGYDENKVYFKDPLGRTTEAPINNFIEAWEQMGSQAITIIK